MKRLTGFLLLIWTICLCGGGCIGIGYQAGSKPLFGEDVHTVYVPLFAADPTRRHLAERLTEAVCKRIEERSPYKVVSRPTADSVLQGRLVERSQRVHIVDDFNDPRQKTGTIKIEVKWHSRREQELGSTVLSWNEGAASASAADTMSAEFGHSQLTSEQRQIEELADKIVGMMEMPW
ncbi:MAG: LPS assembly lipoprotein LptE [Planctomycetaceae bacterium]|jgi:hypothetical protein|nr:LPS assembly lipoprotein LptE [Planctomycetaceae bacterium]